jgi:hypothetical protein
MKHADGQTGKTISLLVNCSYFRGKTQNKHETWRVALFSFSNCVSFSLLSQSIKLRSKFPTEDRVVIPCWLVGPIASLRGGDRRVRSCWKQKTKLHEVNFYQCHSVYWKIQMDCSGIELRAPQRDTGAYEPGLWQIPGAQHKYRCHILIALTRFFLEHKLQDYSKNCCVSCQSCCLYVNRSASIPHDKRKDRVHNSVIPYRLSNGLGGTRPHPLFEMHFEIIRMPTRNFLLLNGVFKIYSGV